MAFFYAYMYAYVFVCVCVCVSYVCICMYINERENNLVRISCREKRGRVTAVPIKAQELTGGALCSGIPAHFACSGQSTQRKRGGPHACVHVSPALPCQANDVWPLCALAVKQIETDHAHVCMCVCIHIYIYIYVCVCIYIYIYMHTYIHTSHTHHSATFSLGSSSRVSTCMSPWHATRKNGAGPFNNVRPTGGQAAPECWFLRPFLCLTATARSPSRCAPRPCRGCITGIIMTVCKAFLRPTRCEAAFLVAARNWLPPQTLVGNSRDQQLQENNGWQWSERGNLQAICSRMAVAEPCNVWCVLRELRAGCGSHNDCALGARRVGVWQNKHSNTKCFSSSQKFSDYSPYMLVPKAQQSDNLVVHFFQV